MKAIADTGFIVALARSQDEHHRWAKETIDDLDVPLLTCEAVLAETAFHLGDVSGTLRFVNTGLLEVAFDVRANLTHLGWLAERYAERNPDLADLCLIRMSEIHPRHVVVTTDTRDFRVYRRNKRDAIPLLCPPR